MPTRFGWGPHGGRPYAEDTLGTLLGSLPLNQSPPPLIHVWHRQRPFPHSLRQMTDNCPGLGGLVAMETASSRKILNRAGDLLFLWMLAALGPVWPGGGGVEGRPPLSLTSHTPHVCVHVRMCVCMCVPVYYLYLSGCMVYGYACLSVYIVCMYFMYTSMCVYVFASYVYMCLYVLCVYTCICMPLYVCMYVHMCVMCICVCWVWIVWMCICVHVYVCLYGCPLGSHPTEHPREATHSASQPPAKA